MEAAPFPPPPGLRGETLLSARARRKPRAATPRAPRGDASASEEASGEPRGIPKSQQKGKTWRISLHTVIRKYDACPRRDGPGARVTFSHSRARRRRPLKSKFPRSLTPPLHPPLPPRASLEMVRHRVRSVHPHARGPPPRPPPRRPPRRLPPPPPPGPFRGAGATMTSSSSDVDPSSSTLAARPAPADPAACDAAAAGMKTACGDAFADVQARIDAGEITEAEAGAALDEGEGGVHRRRVVAARRVRARRARGTLLSPRRLLRRLLRPLLRRRLLLRRR